MENLHLSTCEAKCEALFEFRTKSVVYFVKVSVEIYANQAVRYETAEAKRNSYPSTNFFQCGLHYSFRSQIIWIMK